MTAVLMILAGMGVGIWELGPVCRDDCAVERCEAMKESLERDGKKAMCIYVLR